MELEARTARLLDAVLVITADLDLETVLTRIVEAACALVDARYGALGVIDENGDGLSAFVHTGLDQATVDAIGDLPRGRGVLGALIDDPRPLRLDHLSDDPRSYGFPPNHPPMDSFLGAPIRSGGAVFGNLYLTEKRDGLPFSADDEELVAALAGVAGVAVANARLVDDLRNREAWRDAALDVASAVLSGAPGPEARERVADAARQLIGGQGAAIVARHGDGPRVVTSVGDGPPLGPIAVEAPVHQVLADNRSIRLETSLLFPAAVLWVPLVELGEVAGALGVGGPTPFTARDESILAGFAAQASLVLAHERAVEQIRRLGMLEDRERIGRDLHDTVIQRLFATGLSLQALMRRVRDQPDLIERLAGAVDDIDATVKEIRSTIFALQEPADAGGSLRGQLLAIVDEVAPHLARAPRVRFDGPVDTIVGDAVASHLVPVVREALTNAAKHAQATQVEVDVVVRGGWLTLHVLDDGIGLPAESIGQGMGLRNLARRAAACGGSFEIAARVEGGTAVAWRVPVD